MKYKNLHLVISAIGGYPFISEIKKNGIEMTDNRKEIPKAEWHKAIAEWLEINYPDKTCVITKAGKPFAELKLLKPKKKPVYFNRMDYLDNEKNW